MTWIQTFSGRRFDFCNPDPADLLTEDIAHALGNLCRFTGHTIRFYSVAEHCVHVSSLVPESAALWGLLHDAAEAYVGDVSRPLKILLGLRHENGTPEDLAQRCIVERYFPNGIDNGDRLIVRHADDAMLAAERDQAMGGECAGAWNLNIEPANVELGYWPPHRAAREFMKRFHELTEQ